MNETLTPEERQARLQKNKKKRLNIIENNMKKEKNKE